MKGVRSRVRPTLVLGLGIVLGWVGSSFRARPVWATAGDRAGECITATGPVLMQYDESTKSPIPLEAVYFLDYKGGRLLATVPSFHQTSGQIQILGEFAERDLIADFQLNLSGAPRPRFAMTTGGLGRFSSGWAPLYVFETTTGQVGVYRMRIGQSFGRNTMTQFELVQMRSYLPKPTK